MNKKKMRIVKAIMGIMTSAIVFFGTNLVSLAGDINSEEQRIIGFYEQVFSYNGELYVATESAKATAYNMLMDDRCDLSAAEVDNYILQASGNIAYGIKQGYLVPYKEGAEDTTETAAENTGTTENTENDGENPFFPNPNEENNSTENNTEETENTTSTEDISENDKNENNDSKTGDGEKVDVDKVVEEFDDNSGAIYNHDGVSISASDIKDTLNNDEKITIENYGEGTVTVIDKDGDILYKGGHPIKNTGYTMGSIVVMLLVMLAGGVVLGLLLRLIRKKTYMPAVMSVGIAIIIFAVYFAGGREYMTMLADKWQSVWVGGAPQYEYTEQADFVAADRKPTIGTLYGEIICDTIGLRAPVYYGDTESIFSDGVGTYSGGTVPGEAGTTIIGGHDTTYFAPLENIKQGDVVSIKTSYGSFEYSVYKTAVASASDEEAYKLDSDEDVVILYTCYPFGELGGTRLERYFVYCERISDGR